MNGAYEMKWTLGGANPDEAIAGGATFGFNYNLLGYDLVAVEAPPGPPGISAYQSWLALGNTGTEAQFIASLQGERGDRGPKGLTGSRISSGCKEHHHNNGDHHGKHNNGCDDCGDCHGCSNC